MVIAQGRLTIEQKIYKHREKFKFSNIWIKSCVFGANCTEISLIMQNGHQRKACLYVKTNFQIPFLGNFLGCILQINNAVINNKSYMSLSLQVCLTAIKRLTFISANKFYLYPRNFMWMCLTFFFTAPNSFSNTKTFLKKVNCAVSNYI